MKIVVVSQNLLNHDYGVSLSASVLLRLNLAWHEQLRSAANLLERYKEYKIFLDVPVGRKKPPSFEHTIKDVALLVADFANIEYVAISNIEYSHQILYYQRKIKGAKIVPKIETYTGIKNIKDIINVLNYEDKVVMLDHQDLYSDLVGREKEREFLELVDYLDKTCRDKEVCLLRTVGIVFSSWENLK